MPLNNRKSGRAARWRPACGVLAMLGLAACSPTRNPPPSDAIAEVGGVAITASELDREFALAGVPADKRGEDQVRLALRELVTRKFLAAKAQRALLENDPVVAGDINRTREQILGAALSQREVKDKALGVKQAEIDAYISDHPRSFAKHVVYAVDQITVQVGADPSAFVAMTRDAKTLEEIDAQLEAKRVLRSRSRMELDSGAISEVFAQALNGQAADTVFFARRDPQGVFFKVLSAEPRPVAGAEAQAKAQIAIQYDIAGQVARADAEAALAASKFVGDYARIMSGAKAAP